MATITLEDVENLARLSNLELSREEMSNLRADLENILGHIDQLAELNTEGIEPTYQVTGLQNVWRQDKVENHRASRSTLVALAAETENNQIKVPKVL